MEESTESKQIVINQHYVPRFYMKNFSVIKGNDKKEKVLIDFYQFKEKLLKENIPTKSICYDKYFYGEDGELEKKFAVKESIWARTIKNIIEITEHSLDEEEETNIKEFVVFQYNRTLGILNHTKQTNKDIVEKILYNNQGKEGEVEFENELKYEVDSSAIVKYSNELIEEINDLNVSIVKFNTINKLITSDMPVIMTNAFSQQGTGFATVGIMLLIPISPDLLIMIYDGKIYSGCNKYMRINNEQDVVNLNKYQAINAEKRILSNEVTELRKIYEDKDIILKREEYIEKRNVEDAKDGDEMILAIKSRSIIYNFELSFCRLPKFLKKIPFQCREPFCRKYSIEEKKGLLFRIYIFPELIKENKDVKKLSEKDIKKIKDGYSKVKNFLYEYWKVPYEGRKISPSMMKNLKNCKVQFFKANR
ncbi:MAG: DUF4238 domain-containing protein [Clostridium sp.]